LKRERNGGCLGETKGRRRKAKENKRGTNYLPKAFSSRFQAGLLSESERRGRISRKNITRENPSKKDGGRLTWKSI